MDYRLTATTADVGRIVYIYKNSSFVYCWDAHVDTIYRNDASFLGILKTVLSKPARVPFSRACLSIVLCGGKTFVSAATCVGDNDGGTAITKASQTC